LRFWRQGTPTVEEAQQAICPKHKIFEPQGTEQTVYDQLYPLYRKLYFLLGTPSDALGDVMPTLIRIAESANRTVPVLTE
jgi:L-ribulokinase